MKRFLDSPLPLVLVLVLATAGIAGVLIGQRPGHAGGKLTGHFDPAMAGCQYSCSSRRSAGDDVVAQPGAITGQLTQCPVSGVVFTVDATRPHVPVAGDDYVTCCESCAQKLSAEPKRYLKI